MVRGRFKVEHLSQFLILLKSGLQKSRLTFRDPLPAVALLIWRFVVFRGNVEVELSAIE